MKLLLAGLVAPLSLLAFSQLAMSEELQAIFKKTTEYVDQQNYKKALEELGWAEKEIEKLHLTKMQTFFPEEIEGLKGEKFETNAMMGFTNVQRKYSGAGSSVTVSLVGGSGQMAGGFGGLAQLGQMAAMMQGNQPGNETIRIGGKTAILQQQDSKSAELSVILDSGSILKLELKGSSDTGMLKKMAEALKVQDLDTYLAGKA